MGEEYHETNYFRSYNCLIIVTFVPKVFDADIFGKIKNLKISFFEIAKRISRDLE